MRILSWNVNGLYNTLKDASLRHSSVSSYFSQVLNADIVSFQEAKIQEEKLEKWIACVPGYESFWAFSKAKKGYSGVVTYVKEALSPLDAKADCLGDSDDPSIEDTLSDGRIMETDHGNFVLINVYIPNAGPEEQGRPRLDFKLKFLEAFKRKCDALVSSGRHVMIVGDFNIAHKDEDVHRQWRVKDLYSTEETAFMDELFKSYIDLFRQFHPDVNDVFSCWDQKKEARIHNEGVRIDFALCDKGFLDQIESVEIVKMFPKSWSDHAAVVCTLKEQPILLAHPRPAISSYNMKQFQEDRRQKTLTTLFSSSLSRGLKEENVNRSCRETALYQGSPLSAVQTSNIPNYRSFSSTLGSQGIVAVKCSPAKSNGREDKDGIICSDAVHTTVSSAPSGSHVDKNPVTERNDEAYNQSNSQQTGQQTTCKKSALSGMDLLNDRSDSSGKGLKRGADTLSESPISKAKQKAVSKSAVSDTTSKQRKLISYFQKGPD